MVAAHNGDLKAAGARACTPRSSRAQGTEGPPFDADFVAWDFAELRR